MKDVLSGATATAADPGGQPLPFTVTTSMVILSGGGEFNPGSAELVELDIGMANANIAAPTAANFLNMDFSRYLLFGKGIRRSVKSGLASAPGVGPDPGWPERAEIVAS
ncbi:hypothetical protein [Nocardia arthritidis]|uniref:hypothetical protein n=1 Tax=Nocardia arthritidis TaxID=228602 RepID=UPI001EE9D9BB|nr:hypothetical protein [Nocardia arthritidis]